MIWNQVASVLVLPGPCSVAQSLSAAAATPSRSRCQVHISLYSSFFKVKVKKQLLRGLLSFLSMCTLNFIFEPLDEPGKSPQQ
jgi:hypothetical protein